MLNNSTDRLLLKYRQSTKYIPTPTVFTFFMIGRVKQVKIIRCLVFYTYVDFRTVFLHNFPRKSRLILKNKQSFLLSDS